MSVLTAAIRDGGTARNLLAYLAARWPGTVLPLLDQARDDPAQPPEVRRLAGETIDNVAEAFGQLAEWMS